MCAVHGKNTVMKKIFLVIALTGCFSTASAWRIEFGNNLVISKPVYEDLYIAGGTVTINAPVYGDLVIAGGTIIINDTVTNDIMLVGGTVTFNGYVGDDIRCAGGKLHIRKDVAGDVVVTGGSLIIDNGTTIGGLLASGGDVTLDGDVNGSIKGVYGELFINGKVAKNIDCRSGRITVNGIIGGQSILAARYIVIGNYAAFHGDVRYWNKKESVDFKQSLRSGKAVYDNSLRIKTGEWYYLGSATILGLLWYLGMALLMIWIMQYMFSAGFKKAADTVFNNTLGSLATGLLFLITVPVAAIIALVTVIGVPVGILLIIGYLTLIIFATAISSLVAANWFNNRNNYQWNNSRLALAAFAIFIVLKIVSFIPFAGWIIISVIACIAFGSLVMNVRLRRKKMGIENS